MLDQLHIPAPSPDDKSRCKTLQKELAGLQQEVRRSGLPIIVLFEGWSAAGKGRTIGKLISELDPRGYQVYSTAAPEPSEVRRPFLWRFWRDLPPRGEIAVLDRSWYRRAAEETALSGERLTEINLFERQLCDDGYLILKFFLHIGREEQRRRLEKLAGKPATAWRVDRADWEQNRRYDTLEPKIDALLDATSPIWAPWHIIWNEDKHSGAVQVLTIIRDAIRTALEKGAPRAGDVSSFPPPLLEMPRLSEIDLSPALDDALYTAAMKKERKKLQQLHSRLYREKIPVIIAFEGWDAAGKGGAIRRLSRALDPRSFDVIPIAAPSPEALARHYLWRFWKEIPKDGHMAIFDRTWYGRVMVERVEGLTPAERWRMAYREINEFERSLHDWGAVILKFWLQIDPDTQLKRFTDRQNTPEKRYKITEEDWRNRSKWAEYEDAVNEMLQHTSTEYAPWVIVEGNNKKYARLKVLRTVRKHLEARLKQ